MLQKSRDKMALHNVVESSMSSQILFTILILSLLFLSSFASASNSTTTTNKKFIKNQCNYATYPRECYKSLSPFASVIQGNTVKLTRVSVNVALIAARKASTTMKKLTKSKGKLTHNESSVVYDCKENIDDTVDLLNQSAHMLEHLNGTTSNYERFEWDTIKTWISAAITDESTCSDELDEMQVRSSLQKKINTTIVGIARKDSNALFFVNRLYY